MCKDYGISARRASRSLVSGCAIKFYNTQPTMRIERVCAVKERLGINEIFFVWRHVKVLE